MYPPEVEASDAASVGDSDVSSAHSAGKSLWVLESRLRALGRERRWEGGGKAAAAAVWSSERLFPTNADKKRKPFNYQITHSNKHLLRSAECLPRLFWNCYSGARDDMDSRFKNMLSI